MTSKSTRYIIHYGYNFHDYILIKELYIYIPPSYPRQRAEYAYTHTTHACTDRRVQVMRINLFRGVRFDLAGVHGAHTTFPTTTVYASAVSTVLTRPGPGRIGLSSGVASVSIMHVYPSLLRGRDHHGTCFRAKMTCSRPLTCPSLLRSGPRQDPRTHFRA